jgi:hypothetical protein
LRCLPSRILLKDMGWNSGPDSCGAPGQLDRAKAICQFQLTD